MKGKRNRKNKEWIDSYGLHAKMPLNQFGSWNCHKAIFFEFKDEARVLRSRFARLCPSGGQSKKLG
jgi:hypothetical protein